MTKNIAVIDLGTNTCNLLIAKIQDESYSILYQGKEVVKLGKDGIDKNMLTEDGLKRTIHAIKTHQQIISRFDHPEILVLATSAIREAKNRTWFQEELERKTGYKLSIISGEKEAELIYKGVKLALGTIDNHSIILDIGGGSNEFILCDNTGIHWKESYPLGMARIVEKFKPSDPVTRSEIEKLEDHFDRNLPGLYSALTQHHTRTLIGASGSFETFASLLGELLPSKYSTKPGKTHQEIIIEDFLLLHDKLINSTSAERLNMKGMEPMRVDMIVPASIFVTFILKKCSLKKLVQSTYSLKEGVLHEQMQKD